MGDGDEGLAPPFRGDKLLYPLEHPVGRHRSVVRNLEPLGYRDLRANRAVRRYRGYFLRSFYSLFPWLVRLIAHLGTSYFVAALIVSGIASIVAVILLRRLVELDYPATVAMRSVWFLLIFPTAYFLHIGYSESLFLALALASILAARADRWLLAGVLGAFCWMTRAPGAVLVPTLAVEAAQQWWVKRRWNWSWVWIAIVPAGFAVYLLINWRVSGNPFGFLQARKEIFEQSFALPLRGIRQAIWAHYHSK
jgi:Gpi18-like mannosyltransferase